MRHPYLKSLNRWQAFLVRACTFGDDEKFLRQSCCYGDPSTRLRSLRMTGFCRVLMLSQRVQRSFVGGPSLGDGLRFLRLTVYCFDLPGKQPGLLSSRGSGAGFGGNPARGRTVLCCLLEDYFLEQFGADDFADFGALFR